MAVGAGTLPAFESIRGVRLGVAEAGIRKPNRKDLVVIEIAEGAEVAAVFTLNAFCAAPVQLAKAHLAATSARYLLINTGNANAGTGPQGLVDATASCDALAKLTGVPATSVLPFSTGVIGEPLPVNRLVAGLSAALADLSESNWERAALGIMTTDTRPKGASVLVRGQAGDYRISGISKGAGMICPNMATMLAYVATDAKVDPQALQALLKTCADASFNRITIDGDTSTNDACVLIASGQVGEAPLAPGHADWVAFASAVQEVLVALSQAIVRDGEGATKFITVHVEQAGSVAEALSVAYAVAHSPLVKTALFACDPNWGRILAAVGRAGLADLRIDGVQVWLGDARIVSNGGRDAAYTEEAGQRVMQQEEITIRIALGRGDVTERVWTTDLSHDYVSINADYRS